MGLRCGRADSDRAASALTWWTEIVCAAFADRVKQESAGTRALANRRARVASAGPRSSAPRLAAIGDHPRRGGGTSRRSTARSSSAPERTDQGRGARERGHRHAGRSGRGARRTLSETLVDERLELLTAATTAVGRDDRARGGLQIVVIDAPELFVGCVEELVGFHVPRILAQFAERRDLPAAGMRRRCGTPALRRCRRTAPSPLPLLRFARSSTHESRSPDGG